MNNHSSSQFRAGFTLVELLVVLAIVALLAALLLPVLSRAKGKAQGIACLNNLRQMQLAWAMYPLDHDGILVLNELHGIGRSWVHSGAFAPSSWPGHNPRAATNTLFLVGKNWAAFADYIAEPSIYRCPGDKSTVEIGGQRHLRVRSYLNAVNHGYESNLTASKAPSHIITFGDVHPGWMLWLKFFIAVGSDKFGTMPAYYHHGAGALAFADGHVESRKWVDPRTRIPLSEEKPIDATNTGLPVLSPNNPDAKWLSDRIQPPLQGRGHPLVRPPMQ
jgi:prepilin-type N-terminal cleavage/methylation domain-containing protein